jgi:hypothetical protein
VQLRDRNGNVLSWLDNAQSLLADSRKFVMNLPDKSQRYRWLADGNFDPALFNNIGGIHLDERC